MHFSLQRFDIYIRYFTRMTRHIDFDSTQKIPHDETPIGLSLSAAPAPVFRSASADAAAAAAAAAVAMAGAKGALGNGVSGCGGLCCGMSSKFVIFVVGLSQKLKSPPRPRAAAAAAVANAEAAAAAAAADAAAAAAADAAAANKGNVRF